MPILSYLRLWQLLFIVACAGIFLFLPMEAAPIFTINSAVNSAEDYQNDLIPLGDVAAMSAGSSHTCAMTDNGGVKCWGNNVYGQLGDGSTVSSSVPVDVIGLQSGVSAIAIGSNHSCAMTDGGEVKCWGFNLNGRLGDGTTVSTDTPVDVQSLTSGVVAIAAGVRHTCALTEDGGIKCWGRNDSGQLGDGTATDRLVPSAVSNLSTGVSEISIGGAHSCALTNSGSVLCWGANVDGQLGDGSNESRSTPANVTGMTSGIFSIAAGRNHACALTTADTVRCWGANNYGQLGDGTTVNRNSPVDTSSLESNNTDIAAGDYHTCALSDDGVKCWGRNWAGQLGDGATSDQSSPVAVKNLGNDILGIAGGQSHTCAITGAGRAKCWGVNQSGQLGEGEPTARTMPTFVSNLSTGVTQISAGNVHTCALTSVGDLQCWGGNRYGRIGDGTFTNRSLPTSVLGLSSSATVIHSGGNHSCSVDTDQTVRCWGQNSLGQLGDGTTQDRNTPVNVNDSTVEYIDVSTDGSHGCDQTNSCTVSSHSCGLTNIGTVKCWGSNQFGQLGDGTNTDRVLPVGVNGITESISLVDVGAEHTCTANVNGSVACWGSNQFGQLGDGTSTNRALPVTVGSTLYSNVSSGDYHTCAVTNTGKVQCWGNNDFGQLGDGTNADRNLPVDVDGLDSGLSVVAASVSHTCALHNNGSLSCWGDNDFGQLGDGTTISRTSPVAVLGLSGTIIDVATGADHSCVLASNGDVQCWGRDQDGQLGTGRLLESSLPIDVLTLAQVIETPTLDPTTPAPVATTPAPVATTPAPVATTPAPTDTPTPLPTEPIDTAMPTTSQTVAPTQTPTSASPVATPTPSGGAGVVPEIYIAYLNNIPGPTATSTHTPTVTPTPQPEAAWQFVGAGPVSVESIAISGDNLFATDRESSSNGGGIYRRDITDCLIDSPFERPFSDAGVLGIDFQNSVGLAAAFGSGLYYASTEGTMWTKASGIQGLVYSVAFAGNTGYAGAGSRIYETINDDIAQWAELASAGSPVNVIRRIGTSLWFGTVPIEPDKDDDLDTVGVWELTLGSDSLIERNEGLPADQSRQIWDILIHGQDKFYLATYDGVYTGQGFDRWQRVGNNLVGADTRSLAIVDDTLYVGTRRINNSGGGVYSISLSNPTTWTPVTNPNPNSTTWTVRDLLYDDVHCGGLLAATDEGVWLLR